MQGSSLCLSACFPSLPSRQVASLSDISPLAGKSNNDTSPCVKCVHKCEKLNEAPPPAFIFDFHDHIQTPRSFTFHALRREARVEEIQKRERKKHSYAGRLVLTRHNDPRRSNEQRPSRPRRLSCSHSYDSYSSGRWGGGAGISTLK